MINQPLTLPCGAEIPNRLCKAAMTEGLASPAGEPTAALNQLYGCLLYTSPSPRDRQKSRMPSSA